MSYCRFHNTLIDLEDCCGALEEGERISSQEWIKATTMREVCERYIQAFDEYQCMEEEDEV